MKKYLIVVALVLVLRPLAASADEGMWMVNALSEALVQKMQKTGLELAPGEIYDESKVSLKDAIVSLDFGCTGSMISEEGLLITNHHCAYSDVHSLSTPEHNYLETGFFANSRDGEIYIPGKSAYFLKKVLDVTDEVEETVESLKASGQPHGSRRVSSILEKKYSKITGYEASLSSMWSGSKYYLALYEVYTDIRLVAAPPVSIAAFGGDIDNWEWPQQKCDFAMYRIYSGPDGKPAPHSDANVPMKPLRHLTISTQGIKPGDFTMIMGYPGRTARYSSSAKVNYRSHITLPVSNKVRSDQMAIIKGWMDKDPDIRLKYSDKYFSLSNVQENDEGFVQNVGRFGASKHIRREERRMLRDEKALLKELEEKYAEVSDAQKSLTYYRETMIRGTGLGLVATRLRTSRRPLDMDKEYSKLDLRVEKDLFRYCLQSYFDNVNPKYFGEYQKELLSRFGKDYDAMFNALWIDRHMTKDDGIYKFFADVNVSDFNKDIDSIMGERSLTALDKEYTQAKYRARKRRHIEQYPDANSTMRLTYGKVSSFKRDGKMLPWQTFSSEILAKENPDSYDFHLLPEWKNLLEEAQDKGLDLPVNFLTDNDITGGNSGSPVLNARGEIVGLAFDGNKESLASDVYWTPGYNKCVNVDIRFVLWTLENYAHCDNILAEIGQK
ncbi:peptidase S46 [Bacteroides sp. CAG:1060]|nr:peptidase S46 [Bacteroides sp. CAG:1060]